MKLLLQTALFGGKAMVQIHGNQGWFFAGEQPPYPALLALEIPGLKSQQHAAITKWLVEHNRAAAPRARGEDSAIPRALWRRAVLDDYLDAGNATTYVWSVPQYFTLAEIATFAETHGPALDGEIRAALATDRPRRATALAKVGKRADVIVPVLYAAQRRIPLELAELEVELDREAVAAVKAKAGTIAAWVNACANLRTARVKGELLADIARRLVDENCDADTIRATLDQMVAKKLDEVPAPGLFEALGHRVPLTPNVSGETIDLTRARETTVVASWAAYKARRVGPVKFGRSALYVTEKRGSEYVHTYVRGERKLKHEIKKRGGTLQRWSATLVVGVKDPSSVQAALLRVDEIDSLAQLAPERAVALLGDLAPTPPITEALAHAPSDPRWRRVLSDLLIERIVGIDADVARRLARAEASANRRRRR